MDQISRRRFLRDSGAGVAATTIAANAIDAAEQPVVSAAPVATDPTHQIHFTVNGTAHRIAIEDRWSLAEVLRDHLGLTGTKIGCERGECGACTVILNGATVYSCSYLAAWCDGATVQTVEGLSRNAALYPLQKAFVEHDGPQCGFCTSGQLMSARALLNANPHPTEDQVKRGLAGNLCRCSNYNRYVESVLAAATAAERPSARGDD